ncbi:hypothetical protein V5O48_000364 [Marasmius crinis-equi]|uniref:Cell wall proline rich protein n=1 Tax=Marasmius crinis-equi TaxID=585013 RepID=A0ABR3G1W2_9AGAR
MAQTRTIRRLTTSSPLTGPSMSADGTIILQAVSDDRPKPSRIQSTSDLPAQSSGKSPSPPPTLKPAHQSRAHQRHPSSPSALRPSSTTHPSSRPSTAPSSDAVATPPVRPPRSTRRESAALSITSTPTPPEDPSSSSSKPSGHQQTSGSTSAHPSNWLTSNTYAEVPRFSRVGLASSNVVLPLSAKQHNKRHTAMAPRPSTANSSLRSLHMYFGSADRKTRSERVDHKRPSTAPGVRENSATSQSNDPSFLVAKNITPRASIQVGNPPNASRSHTILKPQMEIGVTPLSVFRRDELMNRHSLFSIPGSPSCLEMEFNMITEDGEEQGIITLSPRNERSFAFGKKSVRPIMIPSASFPVDVELETPITPSWPNRMSIRRLSINSRTHSSGPLSPKRKQSIKQRKSLASLKAHKRAISRADSVLAPTSPLQPTRHKKGASFLSFTSSDGSEVEGLDDVGVISEDSGEDSDSTLHRRRSVDNASIASDDLRDAQELLSDVLAPPTYSSRRERSFFIAPPTPPREVHIASMSRKSRSFSPGSFAPPPTADLPSLPPFPREWSFTPSVSQPNAGPVVAPDQPYPITHIQAAMEPSQHLGLDVLNPRNLLRRNSTVRSSASRVDQELASPTTDRLRHSRSFSDLEGDVRLLLSDATTRTPPLAKMRGFLGVDDSDTASVLSGSTVRSPSMRRWNDSDSESLRSAATSRGTSKAMGLLGMSDDDVSSPRPSVSRKFSNVKALEKLGVYGDDSRSYMSTASSIGMRPAPLPGTSGKSKKEGVQGVKKLWKSLTGGSMKRGTRTPTKP